MMKLILNKNIVIGVTLFLCVSMYLLSFYVEFRINESPFNILISYNDKQIQFGNKTKKILFWTTLFGDKNFYFGNGDMFKECPVSDCYATHNRGEYDITKFDALLFHGNDLLVADLPTRRDPQQWYIYVNLESPANRNVPPYFRRNYFNLTMTYRLDSDIVWTYGVVTDIKTGEIVAPFANTSWRNFQLDENAQELMQTEDEEEKLRKLINRKKKPISWFVSNCKTKSSREKYVEELSKHIEVDIYGRCGKFRCNRSSDCYRHLVEPEYFFYLSFENSLCQDYVTEKLYDPLRYYVVPIVYGGGNYSIFAPENSYINTMDFNTPKDLADYLKILIKNPKEYQKYFAWKKYYKIEGGTSKVKCELCKFLHEKNKPKTYASLSEWYSNNACPLQQILPNKG